MLLLDRGVDINAVDGTGQSALHVAAGQAGESIVTALVQRGAKLDLKDRQGRTPLGRRDGHRRPGGSGSADRHRRAAATPDVERVILSSADLQVCRDGSLKSL